MFMRDKSCKLVPTAMCCVPVPVEGSYESYDKYEKCVL
jgi:hypothetical protein